MGLVGIANQLFPKADHLKKTIKRIDTLITFEEIINTMISIFFWVSILELVMFVLSLFIFFFHPAQMAIIWMYMLHIPKGVLGLIMVFKLSPLPYDMIDSISDFPDTEVHLSFQEIGDHINDSFKKKLLSFL